MPQYWVLVHLTAHGAHPVSHSDDIQLKTYFDEEPNDNSDMIAEGDGFIVPVEHSIPVTSLSNTRCWHKISVAEFNASSYAFHIWAEPYASAALQKSGAHSDLAVGRMMLENSHETRRTTGASYPTRYSGVADDDEIIVFEVKLANSVIQYIVDEMNTNRNSGFVARHRDMRNDHAILQIPQRPFSTGEAFYRFRTGAEWDHKWQISPVWGARNRLGNTSVIYYYDYWSNIHYGFILGMAGYGEDASLISANVAQLMDHGEQDSEFDKEPIWAGLRLSMARGNNPAAAAVTRQDIINILNNHTHWDEASRTAATRTVPRVSPMQQMQDEMRRFDNMSPMDQADLLRQIFGG